MVAEQDKSIKLMSFNIRNGGETDGVNGISKRHPVIKKMIERERPDIIGFQEIDSIQRRWVREILGTEYALVGGGRDQNYRGEGCSVAFKTDIMELVNMETCWMSDTPDVAGSRFHGVGQSKFPRLFHRLTLKHKEASALVTVINTHLDHVGPEARKKELEQLLNCMKRHEKNCALMGDFNIQPTAYEMVEFSKKIETLGIYDVTAPITATYHEFGRCSSKIDYIYTDLACKDVYAVTDKENGVFCSDHYPVCAVVRLP